jgi:hypothetical protein
MAHRNQDSRWLLGRQMLGTPTLRGFSDPVCLTDLLVMKRLQVKWPMVETLTLWGVEAGWTPWMLLARPAQVPEQKSLLEEIFFSLVFFPVLVW